MAKRFFFHYNKPASRILGSHKLSFHYQGRCDVVDKITCAVPTESKINKRQPFVVMQGWANRVSVKRSWNKVGLAVLEVEVH